MTFRLSDEAVSPRRRMSAAKPRWAFFRKQFDLVRAQDGTTYLTRWWIVAAPWGGLVLHRMMAPDARPDLHDHPFSFVSLVLRGGYTERRLRPRGMDVEELRHVRRWNVMRPWDAHSIRALDRTPTWTLLLIGPQVRTWGFLLPTGKPGSWRWVDASWFDSGHYVPDATWRSGP